MYASSPGLSALEHPVYDVWVIQCSAAALQTLPEMPQAPGAAPGTTPAAPAPNIP
jgi:hypothetical protein